MAQNRYSNEDTLKLLHEIDLHLASGHDVASVRQSTAHTHQPAPISNLSNSTVKAQQKLLAETFTKDDPAESTHGENDDATDHDGHGNSSASGPLLVLAAHRNTIIKSLIAIIAAFALIWTPLQRILSTTSAQAIVNARVVTIRAPIDGVLSSISSAIEIGRWLSSNELLLTIRDHRADTVQINAIERVRAQAVTRIVILQAKQRFLRERIASQTSELDRFQRGRIKRLQILIGEIDAQISSASASYETSGKALKRANTLLGNGFVSRARFEKLELENTIAQKLVEALRKRRLGILVELDALKKGTYIGDSNNDIPLSAQRRLDNELKLVETNVELDRSKIELRNLNAQLVKEKKRHKLQETAIVRSAVSGRIWEVLVAPGERVSRGQILFKILDCTNAMVTAAVSETAYHKLKLGQAATFRPRNGGQKTLGRIIGLSGLAAIRSNNAIPPSVLSKEPYFVTLKFPGLNRGSNCNLGQSGIVTFDAQTPELDQTALSKITLN